MQGKYTYVIFTFVLCQGVVISYIQPLCDKIKEFHGGFRYSQTRLLRHQLIWHLICSIRYSVLPVNSSLLSITLWFWARTVLIYVCIYRVHNVFYVVRHLDSIAPYLLYWPSFRFFSFMAFFIPSFQCFFGLPHALFCFGIHFNAILGNLPSAILWTWPYHVSWFCSISLIIVSSSPICCLIVTFLILSFLDILEDLLRASISVASTRLLLFSACLHSQHSFRTTENIQSLSWHYYWVWLYLIWYDMMGVTFQVLVFPVGKMLHL